MPLKDKKSKGSRNERRAVKYYEALGYRCTKSGGSLGTFDIIALGTHDTYLIQVKSNKRPGKKEMKAMEDFTCPPFTHKVLVIWKDYVKEPIIEPIARSRPEKEVVDIISHPVHGPREAIKNSKCNCPSKTNGCIDCGGLPG